jgi:tRNA pseudouridine(55) synthase
MEVLYESLSGYGVPPADKIARLLSREKPKYRLSKPKTKFNIKAMDNPSEFIQRKAGIPKDEIIPFDRVKAVRKALNRKKQEEARVRGRASVLVRDYDFREDEAEMQSQMEADIHKAALAFTGEITQTPPLYSAVKIDGKRAYDIARKGGDAEIKSRQVQVYEFEITQIEMPHVHFRIACSKGTYIRSMARDFGLFLGSGAYLTNLRRTKIGDYCVEDAKHPKEFTEELNESNN